MLQVLAGACQVLAPLHNGKSLLNAVADLLDVSSQGNLVCHAEQYTTELGVPESMRPQLILDITLFLLVVVLPVFILIEANFYGLR